MLYRVPRTVTEKTTEDVPTESRSVADYRDRSAYVLLGEPGAGKSSLFEEEAENTGDGYYISARDFIDLDNEEWRDKTLFIDGLDEARAGKEDARTPLGAIRGKLNKLGCKRFRISCREADWLGALDNKDLAKVSQSQEIAELYLDSLSNSDVRLILVKDSRVGDADSFIEKAERSGLSGLLDNPQTLDMLIDAVKGGREWPTTKEQVYRLASEQLVAEFNDEHWVAEKNTVNIPALLDAAGLLYAIQLLANLSGFSEGYAQPGRVSLASLDLPPATRAALKTRLFRKVDDEYSYVHRSIAEYLAAYFIAGKIKDDLLVNRVLALTTGVDGGIVAALRGLMAWLGVLSNSARDRLIEIDPLGLVVYGDSQLFSTQTKSRLLRALIREAQTTGFPNRDWHTTAFSALCTKDMAGDLMQVLVSPGCSDGEQYLLYCLLKGLCCSETIAEIKPVLLSVIGDETYWESIRSYALDAFMHQYPEDFESLLSLADDIRQGKIEETENGLLETILDKLFPSKITAANIFKYLIQPKNIHTISYHYFWQTTFGKNLPDDDLPTMLDELFCRGTEFLETLPHEYLFDVVGQLLLRGLLVHGDFVGDERLYRWLSIGIDQYGQGRFLYEQQERICDWLSARPGRYLGLLAVGLKQITIFENVGWEINKLLPRLRYATPPEGLGLWWLDQSLSETNLKLRYGYFQQAFWSLQNKQGDSGLSLDYFLNWVERHPEFLEAYNNLICWPIDMMGIEPAESRKKWADKRRDELAQKLEFLHLHRILIAEGNASPYIFNQLAMAFDHRVKISGKTNDQRLSEYLNNDESLIAAAKIGLRKILHRTDIPSAADILALDAKGEYHYIRCPFLVCLDNLHRENPDILNTISDDLLNSALAFCFTEGSFSDTWFKSLCRSRSDLVARAYSDYITAFLATKAKYIHGLHYLIHDDDCKPIAKQIVLPLLEKYPVRGYKDHIQHLSYLLKAAIANCDNAALLATIERKLACKGMDAAQRIYWLGTGLIVDPASYGAVVKQEVGGNTTRINYLSSFLLSMRGNENNFIPEQASTTAMLIELFAPRCRPEWPNGVDMVEVTRTMEERDYVSSLLNNLAANPGEDAGKFLADLLEQPKLVAWHTRFHNAQQTQQISRREALYKHPDAFQIIETLNNQKPANVADLSVLALECLEKLSEEMHGSNTDSYKQFWNLDGKSPKQPRYEEVCRNYLADLLKPMLAKYDVAVESEALQANEKSADLKLSFIRGGQSYYLPIEIKRDYHREMWKTIHQQLIPLYTISPETEGRGLYLVLWFNFEKLPTHPQGLPPPKSAAELEEMLKATLTPQQRTLIDVFVLDVSATTLSKPS